MVLALDGSEPDVLACRSPSDFGLAVLDKEDLNGSVEEDFGGLALAWFYQDFGGIWLWIWLWLESRFGLGLVSVGFGLGFAWLWLDFGLLQLIIVQLWPGLSLT